MPWGWPNSIIQILHIKPQREGAPHTHPRVVLYRFSTSNHNSITRITYCAYVVLYRFSTSNHNSSLSWQNVISLYYIVSLHQTTTGVPRCFFPQGCIISFLYIKPQPACWNAPAALVVLYRFSTSNHNEDDLSTTLEKVVLYRFSTSNHNRTIQIKSAMLLYYIVSLHQTTTHYHGILSFDKLYYIVSLHQTTTVQLSLVL